MRKLLATLLTICMVAALFGVAPVAATEYSAATEVVYGGYKLDAATPYLHASSNRNANQTLIASSNKTEEGRFLLAEFDAETGTLTYKDGYAIETRAGVAEGALGFNSKTNFALDSADGIKYGIKANGSLTIDVGDFNNSLFIAWNADIQNFNLRGIDVAGDLTVKGGAGMLQITGTAPLDTNKDDDAANEYTSYAINTLGDVNFLGGTVFIYDFPYTNGGFQPDSATFVNAGGDINISGATLRFRAKKAATYVTHMNKSPNITGEYKIYDNENLEIHSTDSSLGFTTDKGSGYGNTNNKTYVPKEAYSNATEIIYGGYKLNAATPYLHASSNRSANQTLIASSNKTEEGRFLLAEFDAEAGTLTYKDGYAIETRTGGAEGALGFNSKTDFALDSADGIKYGIKANGSLTIDVGDFNNSLFIAWNADIQNFNLRGIDVAGDLTVKGGTGMLQITGSAPLDTNKEDDAANEYTSYAINTLGDVNFLGGTVFIYDFPYTNSGFQPDTAVFVNSGSDINLSGGSLRFRARKAATYVTHMNKAPNMTVGYKSYSNENLEIHTTDSSLGFTTDKGAGYGNTNNKTYIPKAAHATEIKYGGVTLDATNKYLIASSKTAGQELTVSDNKRVMDPQFILAEFDAETGTLTYTDGYTLEAADGTVEPELTFNAQTNMVRDESDNTKYGIKANGSLTIDLGSYHNAFYVNWNDGVKDVNISGIDVAGDLTVKGTSGSIKISANAPNDTTRGDGDLALSSYGINAEGDVKLLGGTVFVYDHPLSGPDAGDTVTFIKAGGNIELSGAKVKFRGLKGRTYITQMSGTVIIPSYYVTEDNANLDMTGANKTVGFTVDQGAGYGNTNNKTYIPAGISVEVGNNNVWLGGHEYKYLHWTTRDTAEWAKNAYEASKEAEGAVAVYDYTTKTLKILEDNLYIVDYNTNKEGAAIESDGALTIDTNGNNLYVISFYNGCGDTICAKGELKLTGTGSILAGNAGTSLASGANAAVLRSDSKIIIDTKANLHTANDKVGASEPRGYVLNAPAVEFTEKAVAKLGTGLAHWDENWDKTSFYPGRIFHANVTDIKIPGEADATVCTDMHADLFKGFGAETETAKTYSPDTFALATYLSVATVDTTVSVDDISVYGGNVKIKLSKGSGLSADAENPEVVVVAAAYDENGMVINAKELRAAADGTVNTIEIGATENVKVYIWSAEDGITPLKKIKIY